MATIFRPKLVAPVTAARVPEDGLIVLGGSWIGITEAGTIEVFTDDDFRSLYQTEAMPALPAPSTSSHKTTGGARRPPISRDKINGISSQMARVLVVLHQFARPVPTSLISDYLNERDAAQCSARTIEAIQRGLVVKFKNQPAFPGKHCYSLTQQGRRLVGEFGDRPYTMLNWPVPVVKLEDRG